MDQPDSVDRRRFLLQLAAGAVSVAAVAGGGLKLGAAQSSELTACLRPPGALDEADFLARCIRCGRCSDACPNNCITPFSEEAGRDLSMKPGPGQRGTPVIFPRRQACMLCSDAPGDKLRCTAACPSGALVELSKDAASLQAGVQMGKAVVDEHLCYSHNGASCGACVRSCPFEGQALSAGMWEKPIVDEAACVGCGLCERACIRYPQAIRVVPRMELA